MEDADLRGAILDGRYEVIEPIAEGAMGSVYRGERLKLGRAVAIKIMHQELPDELASRQRFEREAKLMALLEHPNCVSVIDFGVHDDKPFLVMDLVRGTSLLAILEQHGRLDVARTADIIRQVLSGLAHAHELGIVHRDIKPANIMISEKAGLGQQVRILDFGLARLTEGSPKLTTGIVVGTPNYMAPEQCKGSDVDARTDLYACGVMMFEMLTGRKPFVADDPIAVVRKHMLEKPPTLAQVDPEVDYGELEAVVARALAKAPADRYASAVEMSKAVEAAAATQTKMSAAALFARAVPDSATTPGHLQATPSGWNVPASAVLPVPDPAASGGPASPQPAALEADGSNAPTGGSAAASTGVPATPAGSLPSLPQAGPYAPPPGIGAGPPFVPSVPPPSTPPSPSPPSPSPLPPPSSAPSPSAPSPSALSPSAPSPSASPEGTPGEPSAAAAPIAVVHAVSASAPAGDSRSVHAPAGGPSAGAPHEMASPTQLRPIPQLPFTLKQLLIGAGGLVGLIIVIAVIAGGGSEKKSGKPQGRSAPSGPVVNTPSRPAPDPAPRIIEQAEALIASESYEAAASMLRKARKEHPDNAEIAYLAGRAYFGQLWWADGIDSFRAAIKLDPAYREDPDLLKAVLKGFLTTPGVDDRIVSFMRHDIGAPMRPYLEETAAKHPTKSRRARARAELDAKR